MIILRSCHFIFVLAAFIQSMTYEVGALEYEDFPSTDEPVWVLGNKYSAKYGKV